MSIFCDGMHHGLPRSLGRGKPSCGSVCPTLMVRFAEPVRVLSRFELSDYCQTTIYAKHSPNECPRFGSQYTFYVKEQYAINLYLPGVGIEPRFRHCFIEGVQSRQKCIHEFCVVAATA
jgi:hypothetical protein